MINFKRVSSTISITRYVAIICYIYARMWPVANYQFICPPPPSSLKVPILALVSQEVKVITTCLYFRQNPESPGPQRKSSGVGHEILQREEYPCHGKGLQLCHLPGGCSQDQRNHLHAFRGYYERRVETRTSRSGRTYNANHHGRSQRLSLCQVPKCPGTSHIQRGKCVII